jgi:hypothetical protein
MNAMAHEFSPELVKEYGERLRDPWWRLTSGALYKIVIKEDEFNDEDEGLIRPFVPNAEQAAMFQSLHYRTVALKARQIGSTTGWCIYLVDHALFNANQRCGVIAHTDPAAKVIFRDKVMFPYRNLPEPLLRFMPLTKDSQEELLFGHNDSGLRVSTSMRSGTLNRLLVTEFGKTAAQFPQRAAEVETGSLRTLPRTAVGIVESTAEGRQGPFYSLCQKGMATAATMQGERRGPYPHEWKLLFFGWWQHAEYRLDAAMAARVAISPRQHEYFDKVEMEMGTKLTLGQRAWYVSELGSFTGDEDDRQSKMWQEFPSTSAEAFQKSSAQYFFAKQVLRARAEGRIRKLPMVSHVPVNSFWDIGHRDGTGIWLHQHLHPNHRFLRYIEGWMEPYSTFIREMDTMNVVWGTHYLPHDADQERQGAFTIYKPITELQKLKPNWNWQVVPRVDEKQHAVTAVREVFPECLFDEDGCKEGIEHLDLYSKRWIPTTAGWSDEALKDEHTEAADAFMQFAQAYESLNVNPRLVPSRHGARKRLS